MKFNSILKNCHTYEAGKPIELLVRDFGISPHEIIKLASNENPYGCSLKVVKKVTENVKNMFMYPDDSMYEIKEALASKFNIESNNIIMGAGSEQLLNFCVKAKCNENSKILMSKTTFAMYEIYGKQVGAKIIKTQDHEHNLEQFLDMYKKEKADIIFLCLPNNPLGECLDKDDVYSFLNQIDDETLVVIDGAYQEYSKYKDIKKEIIPKDLISKYPNCIYLGTFSKAYSLGGMRIGYAIAQKEIIKIINKLRSPFNVTTLSLVAAIEALKDEAFVKETIVKNFEQMKKYENYANEKNITYINSYTNFITFKLKDSLKSSEISLALLKRGIIIRDLSAYKLNAIRITIGTQDQNKKVIKNLDEIIEQYK